MSLVENKFHEPTTMDEFNALLEGAGDKPVFVKFSATWCPPCQAVAPILHDIAKENKHTCVFIHVDCDNAGAIAQAHNVQGIPDMRIWKKGTFTPYQGARNKQAFEDAINAAM